MFAKETNICKLYVTTGTGDIYKDDIYNNIGWYIGFVETTESVFSFACILIGENNMGIDAKEIVMKLFRNIGMI